MADDFRDRYADRTEHPDRRPEGTLPVETLFFAYPVEREGS